MKVHSVLTLSLIILCYLSAQQCNAGEADVLSKFLKARRANHLHTTRITNGLAAAEKQRSVSGFIVPQVGSKEDDKISALPGQPSGVNFDQYSGYVTVDADAGRALFYYFTESTQDPSTKPLVLWLNGGPGCSSLGAGAMMELGPFRVNKDGKTLWLNPFAWNNDAFPTSSCIRALSEKVKFPPGVPLSFPSFFLFCSVPVVIRTQKINPSRPNPSKTLQRD